MGATTKPHDQPQGRRSDLPCSSSFIRLSGQPITQQTDNETNTQFHNAKRRKLVSLARVHGRTPTTLQRSSICFRRSLENRSFPPSILFVRHGVYITVDSPSQTRLCTLDRRGITHCRPIDAGSSNIDEYYDSKNPAHPHGARRLFTTPPHVHTGPYFARGTLIVPIPSCPPSPGGLATHSGPTGCADVSVGCDGRRATRGGRHEYAANTLAGRRVFESGVCASGCVSVYNNNNNYYYYCIIIQHNNAGCCNTRTQKGQLTKKGYYCNRGGLRTCTREDQYNMIIIVVVVVYYAKRSIQYRTPHAPSDCYKLYGTCGRKCKVCWCC